MKWKNYQKHKLPKLTQEEIENLKRPIRSKAITNQKCPKTTTKSLGPDCFTGEFYRRS